MVPMAKIWGSGSQSTYDFVMSVVRTSLLPSYNQWLGADILIIQDNLTVVISLFRLSVGNWGTLPQVLYL
jgi:hypothetical protein